MVVREKKEKILEAAEYLFATKGFAKTTISEIARKTGINEASIMFYFSTKRNILHSIYSHAYAYAVQDLHQHFLGMKNAAERIIQ